MSPYRYRAARSDGAIVSGILEAQTESRASATLADRGLYLLALTKTSGSTEPRRAANRRDLAIVFHSIASLVAAGVPLERAVVGSERVARGALREVLIASHAALREGQTLSETLAATRGVVPSLVVGMLRAGERGSQMPAALEQVARHLEHEADLVGRVRQALAYPMLLAIAGTASILVIGTVIIPRFADLLGDVGENVPVATRLLLTVAELLSHFWWAAVMAAGLAVWVATEWIKHPRGRRTCDRVLLGLPLIGPLRHALATARVMRALGSMLRAGMPILPTLDAALEAAGDVEVGERFHRARERVAAGSALTTALDREYALLPAALQLLSVGETSGRLDEMALRAGDLAAQDAERGIRTLVTLLEPALIVLFGGVVAFVAAALLQAVYSLRPGGF